MALPHQRDDDDKNNGTDASDKDKQRKKWIRGVNVGGWLVMERYIAPYQVRYAVRLRSGRQRAAYCVNV